MPARSDILSDVKGLIGTDPNISDAEINTPPRLSFQGMKVGRVVFRHICPRCQKGFTSCWGRVAASKRKFCSHICAMLGRTREGSKVAEPTRHPTPLDIAWAAGLFEGEGWCGQGTKGNTTACCIAQKGTWVLDLCLAFFGGVVGPENKVGVSMWRAGGSKARGFLMTIYSFLSPRRKEQVRRALGYAN